MSALERSPRFGRWRLTLANASEKSSGRASVHLGCICNDDGRAKLRRVRNRDKLVAFPLKRFANAWGFSRRKRLRLRKLRRKNYLDLDLQLGSLMRHMHLLGRPILSHRSSTCMTRQSSLPRVSIYIPGSATTLRQAEGSADARSKRSALHAGDLLQILWMAISR